MELLKGIKNIIFDLGGVVINIDYQITINELRKLGMVEIDKLFNQYRQEPWCDSLDRGHISSQQFIFNLKNHLPDTVSEDQVIKAWNAMVLDFPEPRAELLKKIKKDYNTLLLSNTNELHIDYYFGKLKEWYGINDMSPFFHKEYYSHIIGKRKPDAEIYEFILSENNLKPEETLFIDDNIQNIEGAAKLGIRSFLLEKPQTIIDVFADKYLTTRKS